MITHYQVKSTMENYDLSMLEPLKKSDIFDNHDQTSYQEHSWHYSAGHNDNNNNNMLENTSEYDCESKLQFRV